MGFLIELPELLEGRVQSNGIEIEVTAMMEGRGLDLWEIVSQVRESEKKTPLKVQKPEKSIPLSKDKIRL